MALTSAARVVSNHVWFFRDGDAYTVPSSGTCGRESKPGAADTGWIKLAEVKQLGVTHEKEEHERFIPSPGKKVRYDVLESKRSINVSFTLDEVQAEGVEFLFGTLALTDSSTQYNPLEGTTKRGWLKIQQYDQDDVLLNTVDLFAHLKVNGEAAFGDSPAEFAFEGKALHSTLNTGTL